LFSLWHIRCKEPLLAAARQGDYALFRLIGALKHVFTDFDGDQGFININSPEDIAAVRSLMPRQKDDGADKAKRNDTEKESGSWQK
jgi:molybdopterin-guanine dinucleotide biosynthesis protein A